MENITLIIQKTIDNIEKRPGMYVADRSFTSLSHFLMGYFTALEDITKLSYNNAISNWLNTKSNNTYSLVWPEYILHHFANEDKEKAYQLVFDYLKEFLRERPYG